MIKDGFQWLSRHINRHKLNGNMSWSAICLRNMPQKFTLMVQEAYLFRECTWAPLLPNGHNLSPQPQNTEPVLSPNDSMFYVTFYLNFWERFVSNRQALLSRLVNNPKWDWTQDSWTPIINGSVFQKVMSITELFNYPLFD